MRTAGMLLLASHAAAAAQMNFLALGDWGGSSDSHPTTKGELDNNKAMGAVAKQLGGIEFVMAMGDNFYSSGIQGNEHSKRFTETFENVFTHENLQVPWYAIAGNHDHKGNVTAQIAYTNDCPSKRWQFPAQYYTFTKSFMGDSKEVSVQVIYLDSVVLAGMSYHDEATGAFVRGEGPADVAAAGSQLQWLEDQLKASRADYLFVSAHYPIYSQCSHGPTRELLRDVLPLLKRYRATGFLAGHDHCLGHFEEDGLFFVLSGAGKECCYSPSHQKDVPSGVQKFGMDSHNTYGTDGGFASLTATESSVAVTYYDAQGKTLYKSKAFPPRRT